MTSTKAATHDIGRQFLASVDKTEIGAAASKLFSASIGDLVMVLSRSAAHKNYSLADIEWMVLPAIVTGQFYVLEAAHKEHGFRVPIAAVTWAHVSEEVDQRLQEQPERHRRIRPDEWASGDIGWLIDVAGRPADVRSAFLWLADGPFKQREAKLVVRDHSGGPRVTTLDKLLPERV